MTFCGILLLFQMSRNVVLRSFRQAPALQILNGKFAWRDKKWRFSLTKMSAPTYSAYAAMSASAGLKPMASYLAPNSKEMLASSSIFVLSCRKSMNSLNASGVRLLRTSTSIKREFLPGFADFINYLLFRHSFIRGTDFRHKLTDFFQMHFCFFRIGFFHFSHLTDKSIISAQGCQARKAFSPHFPLTGKTTETQRHKEFCISQCLSASVVICYGASLTLMVMSSLSVSSPSETSKVIPG